MTARKSCWDSWSADNKCAADTFDEGTQRVRGAMSRNQFIWALAGSAARAGKSLQTERQELFMTQQQKQTYQRSMGNPTAFGNTAAPYRVFATREEWEQELRRILAACVKAIRQNPEEAAKPPVSVEPEREAHPAANGTEDTEGMKAVKEFARLVESGMEPGEAFVQTAQKLKPDEEEPPVKKRRGIRENGAVNRRTGVTANDPASLNDEDFKRYIKRIMGGNL